MDVLRGTGGSGGYNYFGRHWDERPFGTYLKFSQDEDMGKRLGLAEEFVAF